MNTPFNINHEVRIKLTERGHQILRENHDTFVADIIKRTGYDPVVPFLPTPVDMEGYSTFQLWEVMSIFGPHSYLGCEQPFETEILIPENDSWQPIDTAPKDGTPVILWDEDSGEPVIARWWDTYSNGKPQWENLSYDAFHIIKPLWWKPAPTKP